MRCSLCSLHFPRQFTGSDSAQHISIPTTPNEFVTITNAYYKKEGGSACLKDGYAPFCKHLFIPVAGHFSFTLPCAYAEITSENKTKIETGKIQRHEGG